MSIRCTRRTQLEIRSEDRFEELDLATVRAFVRQCDEAGVGDGAVVSVDHHGDCLIRLSTSVSGLEWLDAPPDSLRRHPVTAECSGLGCVCETEPEENPHV